MRALLRTLHGQGARVLVATGKPERAGRRILEYFRLMSFIDGISGVGPVDAGVDKPALIRRVLGDTDPSNAVMIGDYPSDMSAAKELGMTGIGVTYGFGDQAKMIASGCVRPTLSVVSLLSCQSSETCLSWKSSRGSPWDICS